MIYENYCKHCGIQVFTYNKLESYTSCSNCSENNEAIKKSKEEILNLISKEERAEMIRAWIELRKYNYRVNGNECKVYRASKTTCIDVMKQFALQSNEKAQKLFRFLVATGGLYEWATNEFTAVTKDVYE